MLLADQVTLNDALVSALVVSIPATLTGLLAWRSAHGAKQEATSAKTEAAGANMATNNQPEGGKRLVEQVADIRSAVDALDARMTVDATERDERQRDNDRQLEAGNRRFGAIEDKLDELLRTKRRRWRS